MSDGEDESEPEVSVSELLLTLSSLSLSVTIGGILLTRIMPQVTYTPELVVEIFIRGALMTALASFFALFMWMSGKYVDWESGVTER